MVGNCRGIDTRGISIRVELERIGFSSTRIVRTRQSTLLVGEQYRHTGSRCKVIYIRQVLTCTTGTASGVTGRDILYC